MILLNLTASEIQIQANCVFEGEENVSGFGQVRPPTTRTQLPALTANTAASPIGFHTRAAQITALLLSLAPLWSLASVLYEWPRKQRRLRRQEQINLRHTPSYLSPASGSPPNSATPLFGLSHGRTDSSASDALGAGKGAPAFPTLIGLPMSVTAVPATTTVTTTSPARGRSLSRSTRRRTLTLDALVFRRTNTEEWREEWRELSTFSEGRPRNWDEWSLPLPGVT